MGNASSKRTFFWQKKKKPPLSKAFNQLKRALPNKKRKKKGILGKLRKDKRSQKKFPLKIDEKVAKRLSLENIKKGLRTKKASPGKQEKDKGGLERVGEQIKRKFSEGDKKELGRKPDVVPPPVNLKEENEAKVPKRKLNDIMRSLRPAGAKASGQQP